MSKKALLVLAEGFEEIEAATSIDILRRSGIDLTIAGLGSKTIDGAHGLAFSADCLLDEARDDYDAIVLPGGLPGAENLKNSETVKKLIRKMHGEGKIIAAICAAPALVLNASGILDGRKVTCYPGFEKNFSDNVSFHSDAVVCDGNILTSRGPGTSALFAFELVKMLIGADKAGELSEGMLYAH